VRWTVSTGDPAGNLLQWYGLGDTMALNEIATGVEQQVVMSGGSYFSSDGLLRFLSAWLLYPHPAISG